MRSILLLIGPDMHLFQPRRIGSILLVQKCRCCRYFLHMLVHDALCPLCAKLHWSRCKLSAATTESLGGGGHCPWSVAIRCSRCLMQEKGNTNGQWWATQLLLALGGPKLWHHCGLRQLSGMLVVVFARTELEVSKKHSVCAPAKAKSPLKRSARAASPSRGDNAFTELRHLFTDFVLAVECVRGLARHVGHSAGGLLLTQALWSAGQDWGGEHLERGLRSPGCWRQQGRGGGQLHALSAADRLRLLPLCCPPGEVHAFWHGGLI